MDSKKEIKKGCHIIIVVGVIEHLSYIKADLPIKRDGYFELAVWLGAVGGGKRTGGFGRIDLATQVEPWNKIIMVKITWNMSER